VRRLHAGASGSPDGGEHQSARLPICNASCESFMKTLKREEIYARDYHDLEHLLESVEGFIENYYNRWRLHSALGYLSPEEFENESEDRNGDVSFGAATMRVFKT
jgi:putative transposase